MRRDTPSALFVLAIIGAAIWVLNHNIATESRDEILLVLTLIPAVVGVLSQIKNVAGLFNSDPTQINPTSNLHYSDDTPAFLRVPKDFVTGFSWHRSDEEEVLLYAALPSIHKYLAQYQSRLWFNVLLLFMGCILFIFTKYALAGVIVAAFAVIYIGLTVTTCYKEQKETVYAISNQRIFIFQKLDDGIYKTNYQAPFDLVTSVGNEANALGRVLNIGNIIVRTFTGKMEILYVSRPLAMGYIIEYGWSKAIPRTREKRKEEMKELFRKKLNIPKNRG